MLPVNWMIRSVQQPFPARSDARLWASALLLSLVLNSLAVLALSTEPVREWVFSREIPPPEPPRAEERVLEMVLAPPEPEHAAPDEDARQRFARTDEDQRSEEPPESASFTGERDTRAASELAPDTDAPPLPAQVGIEQRSPDDIETTESDFRDGPLDAPGASESASEFAEIPRPEGADVETPGDSDVLEETAEAQSPPPEDRLLEGPLTTDVPVPPESESEEDGPPEPEPAETPPQGVAESPLETQPAEDAADDRPGFRGHQRKTTLRGSISRTGRSALDVQDSALGRYQAQISRAVELEWQRNCVRHRDFITPGFLTVRFFVEPSGRVRTVEFVGEMETGEVQKGFTLNSIRNAAIPEMPAGLREELGGEPLELIFNFYF